MRTVFVRVVWDMKKVVHIFLIVSCHFCTRKKKTYSICENDIRQPLNSLYKYCFN